MASAPTPPIQQGQAAQGPAPMSGVTLLIAKIAILLKAVQQAVPQAAEDIQQIQEGLRGVMAKAMGGQPSQETPAPPM